MKNVFVFILSFFCLITVSCGSKKTKQNTTTGHDLDNLLKKEFKLLRNPSYPPYKNKIITEIADDHYIFNYIYDNINYQIIVPSKYYSDYLPLFEAGLLHPKLINCFHGTIASVGQFKEYVNPLDKPKRRYKLWSWCKGVMNPCEYIIELLNKNATEDTSTKDFIKGATVVHISQCSVII